MIPFDNYEISPCQRLDDAGLPDPNGNIYEVCEPEDAHCWTLYGHIPGEGVQAIGDFASREDADEIFQRITGIPFGSHEEVEALVRMMHAGPRLLVALGGLVKAIRSLPVAILNGPMCDALTEAKQAAAEAGRAA